MLKEFTDGPRIKVPEHEELSLMNLEKKIEDKYPSYEEIAHVSNFLRIGTCTVHIHTYCHKTHIQSKIKQE